MVIILSTDETSLALLWPLTATVYASTPFPNRRVTPPNIASCCIARKMGGRGEGDGGGW